MSQAQHAPDWSTRCARLLPAGVGWHFSEQAADAMPLESEELLAAIGMSPRRVASFRHGRHCARLALRQLGEPACAIPMGKRREPIWPRGIAGSITHSDGRAAATAVHRHSLAGIGIDLETRGTLRKEVVELICLPEELAMLQAKNHPNIDARLIFSAKESIYKCLWPHTGRYIDFKEVQIEVSILDSSFRISKAPSLPADLVARLQGRFIHARNAVFTLAYV